ncbi:PREDICTED: uncharacterized protein K02A2.6-like [Vollenhovia emeryi]|uniref:uncharacterized protein K02A2.6-like n=1 Tax=Vollenhovia emeryi TaxID=411798 RepID=UPI0005F50424|nr:PREDICTED: uncharacterized protein K02A2.6-like [Vollenhovia emeryi]
MSTANTILVLDEIFATFGYPKYLVSDNGRTFIAKEFKNFLEKRGVKLKLTAPYHPATNGQAERFVQTLKNSLKRMCSTGVNVETKLQEMLIQYRTMPHSVTGKSPAELFLGRQIRNRLQLIFPEKHKEKVPFSGSFFKEGERVSCRNYIGMKKWKFGRISSRLGECNFEIKLDNGQIWRRHVDQMRKIGQNTPVVESKIKEHVLS